MVVAGASALAMATFLGWPGPSPSVATPQVAIGADTSHTTGSESEADGVTLAKADVSQPQKLSLAPLAPPKPPAPAVLEQTLKIKRGDTLMAVLVNAGVNRAEAHNSIEALREVWDPRKLRPGDEITLTFDSAAAPEGGEVFKGFTFEPQPALRVGAVRDTDGAFSPAEEKAPVVTQAYKAEGTITSSLFQNGVEAGLPVPVLIELIKAYSYDVDFQRDIQPGDSFEVMFERESTEDGRTVREGNVQYAALTLSASAVKSIATRTPPATSITTTPMVTVFARPCSARPSTAHGCRRVTGCAIIRYWDMARCTKASTLRPPSARPSTQAATA